ncbi:hypothetical protein [Nocardia sp. NPDC057353]|uniref:hypothetical protein n=1 Tax=Nocardia sp. NPDC057353 TaxID=3346104 RepID=UPI003636EDAE
MTGQMNITDDTATAVYTAIRALLAEHALTELTGVSCIANGADSVFARAVLDSGARLEVVLPSRNYRVAKVKPDHAAEFDDLAERATDVRVMDFDNAGREAYEAANEAVLGTVDRMVAVWDGDTGQAGGTGSVVALARERGVPVDVVWPADACRA